MTEAIPTAWPARLLTWGSLIDLDSPLAHDVDLSPLQTVELKAPRSPSVEVLHHSSLPYDPVIPFTYLSKDQAKIANGVLYCPLKLLEMSTSILDASESHK